MVPSSILNIFAHESITPKTFQRYQSHLGILDGSKSDKPPNRLNFQLSQLSNVEPWRSHACDMGRVCACESQADVQFMLICDWSWKAKVQARVVLTADIALPSHNTTLSRSQVTKYAAGSTVNCTAVYKRLSYFAKVVNSTHTRRAV